jgi:D-serine deaminase-like pyridoxal phosphate-dependent protein
MIANQIPDRVSVDWVSRELRECPEVDLYCFVDSLAGLAILDSALREAPLAQPLRVLLEFGAVSGRAGVRSLREGQEVAAAVTSNASLALAGVAGYEGAVPGNSFVERHANVDKYLQGLRTLAVNLAQKGHFEGQDEMIVSAGGSAFCDLIASRLCGAWDEVHMPVRVVARAGQYAFHDATLPEGENCLGVRTSGAHLEPALELWARILSRPEAGLAIAGFGKRDASYDIRLPQPVSVATRDGKVASAASFEVMSLNDQHALVRVPEESTVAVGDLIGLAVAHPCTAIERWKLLPVVESNYDVVSGIRTYF